MWRYVQYCTVQIRVLVLYLPLSLGKSPLGGVKQSDSVPGRLSRMWNELRLWVLSRLWPQKSNFTITNSSYLAATPDLAYLAPTFFLFSRSPGVIINQLRLHQFRIWC